MMTETLLYGVPALVATAVLSLVPFRLDLDWRELANALVGAAVIAGGFYGVHQIGIEVAVPALPFLGGLVAGYLLGSPGSVLRVGAAMGLFCVFPMTAFIVLTEFAPQESGFLVLGMLVPAIRGLLSGLFVMALGTAAAFVAASLRGGISAYERDGPRMDYGLDEDGESEDGEENESSGEAPTAEDG